MSAFNLFLHSQKQLAHIYMFQFCVMPVWPWALNLRKHHCYVYFVNLVTPMMLTSGRTHHWESSSLCHIVFWESKATTTLALLTIWFMGWTALYTLCIKMILEWSNLCGAAQNMDMSHWKQNEVFWPHWGTSPSALQCVYSGQILPNPIEIKNVKHEGGGFKLYIWQNYLLQSHILILFGFK